MPAGCQFLLDRHGERRSRARLAHPSLLPWGDAGLRDFASQGRGPERGRDQHSPTARGHRSVHPHLRGTRTLEVYTRESNFFARAKCHVTERQKETERSKVWSKLSNYRATSKKGPHVNWKQAFDG